MEYKITIKLGFCDFWWRFSFFLRSRNEMPRWCIKKSASSHDEAALLGKKYHIAAKLVFMYDLCKFFRWKLNFFD